MTKEEAKEWLPRPTIISTNSDENHPDNKPWMAYEMAIKALEQEPRKITLEDVKGYCKPRCLTIISNELLYELTHPKIKALEQEPKTGHCKDCKFFEYDSVAKVDGIPLIVAHEICSKWGDGCKTKEDGYCFLFEPQERKDME